MSESDNYDLLVVGAGPAGSFAAERLARGGARVALFDGRPPNEPKACGGGVTSKALKAWPHLSDAAGRTVDEVEMFSPEGARVSLKLAQPFAIYSRTALDSHLRERARAAGVEVFAERVSVSFDRKGGGPWRVRERATGREWFGRVLVAADGANSPVARRLAGALPNAEMEVAFGYRAPLPKSADAPTVIAFLPGWIGYAWAFPRLDHVSFGIATTQDAFEHRPLDALLWDFMLGYYAQREDPRAPLWSSTEARGEGANGSAGEGSRASIEVRLRESVERYAARIPGLAPETFDTRRVGGDDWALLGDAAGFADPVTGEGIYYALRSAELFADCYLAGRVPDYERRWRADFGRELQRASRMRRRFYGRFLGAPFTSRMIDFARLHPGIRRTLRELVAGDQGYVGLKRTLALRALWPR
ncbi:MAG: NAD(P)/FAD-dependent oxidoreductase [Acidobacteria bacterium]|nr:NAD(P)/FAD-dependent oxidoreductase [Acidobacteriota bacterium]